MNLGFYLCSEIGMWSSSKICIEKHAWNVWRLSKHLFGWTTLSRTSILYKVHFSILALDEHHGRSWSWHIYHTLSFNIMYNLSITTQIHYIKTHQKMNYLLKYCLEFSQLLKGHKKQDKLIRCYFIVYHFAFQILAIKCLVLLISYVPTSEINSFSSFSNIICASFLYIQINFSFNGIIYKHFKNQMIMFLVCVINQF